MESPQRGWFPRRTPSMGGELTATSEGSATFSFEGCIEVILVSSDDHAAPGCVLLLLVIFWTWSYTVLVLDVAILQQGWQLLWVRWMVVLVGGMCCLVGGGCGLWQLSTQGSDVSFFWDLDYFGSVLLDGGEMSWWVELQGCRVAAGSRVHLGYLMLTWEESIGIGLEGMSIIASSLKRDMVVYLVVVVLDELLVGHPWRIAGVQWQVGGVVFGWWVLLFGGGSASELFGLLSSIVQGDYMWFSQEIHHDEPTQFVTEMDHTIILHFPNGPKTFTSFESRSWSVSVYVQSDGWSCWVERNIDQLRDAKTLQFHVSLCYFADGSHLSHKLPTFKNPPVLLLVDLRQQ